MPLSKLQSDILRLLASHRDPESYVAGSTPLNWNAPRFSGDIDFFHDREERVTRAVEEDSAVLQEQGFTPQWLRRELNFFSVLIHRGDESTKLEWVLDSDFRFFPTVKDELFGYVLHPIDLATNKVMAAAGRREPRDVVDLVMIHEQVLPLGAVVWAAVGKSLGFTPEGLINEIRRLARYTEADFRRVASDPPVDPAETMTRLRQALNEAEAFVIRMPTEKIGLLFLKDGRVVQPDPDHLDDYAAHEGQRRGHWPTSSEISAAMFAHYQKNPPSP
ncbi:MAG: nucleotidyl transferase AbiEii/AbiGii toxin family protein [Deltaproteobacteria bacterium]|nr:nucleotidyl transferase AbiEii/AbiGii toxin family protein [Deltaproteobacteria bacterium]